MSKPHLCADCGHQVGRHSHLTPHPCKADKCGCATYERETQVKKPIKALLVIAAFAVVGAGLTACTSDSDTASQNISTEAEQFRIQREIVFYNGITDKYIAVVTGKCSVDSAGDGLPGGTLAVTCKVGSNKYIKDYLGKSDNVTWFEIQQEPVAVDVYHTEVVFKPQNVIPYLNVELGKNGATGNSGSDFESNDTNGSTVFTPTAPSATPTPIITPSK